MASFSMLLSNIQIKYFLHFTENMSNLQDQAAGIPMDYLVPSGPYVDVALQSAAEVEDLLTVSPPKPVVRFEDPPESLDDPNLEEDPHGKW